MPKNNNPSLLDHTQCQKLSFQEEHDAIRVINVLDSQHSIEIKAEEGDSIESVARAKTIKSEDGAVDCSRMRKICGFDAAVVILSPDGVLWTLPLSLSDGQAADLCAIKIKVSSGQVVVRS